MNEKMMTCKQYFNLLDERTQCIVVRYPGTPEEKCLLQYPLLEDELMPADFMGCVQVEHVDELPDTDWSYLACGEKPVIRAYKTALSKGRLYLAHFSHIGKGVRLYSQVLVIKDDKKVADKMKNAYELLDKVASLSLPQEQEKREILIEAARQGWTVTGYMADWIRDGVMLAEDSFGNKIGYRKWTYDEDSKRDVVLDVYPVSDNEYYLWKSHSINSLEDFCALINAAEDWPLQFDDIIDERGWISNESIAYPVVDPASHKAIYNGGGDWVVEEIEHKRFLSLLCE